MGHGRVGYGKWAQVLLSIYSFIFFIQVHVHVHCDHWPIFLLRLHGHRLLASLCLLVGALGQLLVSMTILGELPTKSDHLWPFSAPLKI